MRVPLHIAAAVVLLIALDAAGVPGAVLAGRIGINVLLATYLFAGVLNLPRFPRLLRGPPTPSTVDGALLDFWSVIALTVGTTIAFDGTATGLF